MRVTTTKSELTALPRHGMRAVVMTMGALHDGHAALIDEARRVVGEHGEVLVTIFVNPLQFGANEDFDAYPRTWEHDEQVCRAHGVDIVFCPSVHEMYGTEGQHITVHPGELGEILEGRIRPGHFEGMLTVVAKLLFITAADVALFGEKDYQQLVCIRRMVDELDMPVQVIGVPTVREADGLAMSSRNIYLSGEERARAHAVPRALQAARERLSDGVAAAVSAASTILTRTPGVEVEYVAIRDPDLGEPTAGPVRILVAVRIGGTRLIDNVAGALP